MPGPKHKGVKQRQVVLKDCHSPPGAVMTTNYVEGRGEMGRNRNREVFLLFSLFFLRKEKAFIMGAAVVVARLRLLLLCVSLCVRVCVCFCVGRVCLRVKGPRTPDLTTTTTCRRCENGRMETPLPCPAASAAPLTTEASACASVGAVAGRSALTPGRPRRGTTCHPRAP